MDNTANLNRFIEAQNVTGFSGYNQAVKEIRKGKKMSHWIWYVFPQLRSISQNSLNDIKYGIENIEEAKAYLDNQTLRARLENVCELLLEHKGASASSIFGVTDSIRVQSFMTLFYLACHNELYKQVLEKYYDGRLCQKTLYALGIKMPPNESINSQSIEKGVSKRTNVQPFSKRQHLSKTKYKKKRRIKKIMILLVGLVFVLGLICAVGYGLYKVINDTNNDSSQMVEK